MRLLPDLLRRLVPALAVVFALSGVAACSDDPDVVSSDADDAAADEEDQDAPVDGGEDDGTDSEDSETDAPETDETDETDTGADDAETDGPETDETGAETDEATPGTGSVEPTPDPVQSVPDELAPYCNASYAMSESPGLGMDDGPEETRAFYEGLIDSLDELLVLAPAELEPDLRTVRENFSEVLRILEEADWDLDAGFAAVGEWADDPEIADAMDAAIDRLEDYDEDVCGITY